MAHTPTYHPEWLLGGAALFRQLLTEAEQEALYLSELLQPALNTSEYRQLTEPTSPEQKPPIYNFIAAQPLCVYQNVFTGRSSIPKPQQILERVQQAWDFAYTQRGSGTLPEEKLDNCYAQLYPANSALTLHQDPYLSWVASLTLGGAAAFTYHVGNEQVTVQLRSGDMLILDGGQWPHQVAVGDAEDTPAWWKQVEHFGMARCNLQLRSTSSLSKDCPDSLKALYVYP